LRPWPPGPRDSALRCHAFVDDVIDQFKRYFSITIGWRGQIGLVEQIPSTDNEMTSTPPSPDLVERVLSPLSNSIRFGMMSSLSVKAQSITELSREMGLQKGHLQFHVKALVDAGYVALDRRTHLYSLTQRGELAWKGVWELVRSMGMQAT
jgi:DNA-binding transcriptional ArsR family regulator